MRRGVQRSLCKVCGREQQEGYYYKASEASITEEVIRLVKEGVGIRGMSRILGISIGTVINRIKDAGRKIHKPFNTSVNGIYEIDELWTYVGRKEEEVWITYSIDRVKKTILL